MVQFLQAVCLALIAVVLGLQISRNEREIGLLLSIAACGLLALAGLRFLEPVLEFIHSLESLAGIRSDLASILIKALGVAMTAELAAAVCADAGNASVGKLVQMVGNAAMLWLAIPLFTAILELLRSILGEV